MEQVVQDFKLPGELSIKTIKAIPFTDKTRGMAQEAVDLVPERARL